jgi:hypothetical protein
MNFKAKAMLAASAYANKEKLTEATTFIKENWLDIATAALAIYIVWVTPTRLLPLSSNVIFILFNIKNL